MKTIPLRLTEEQYDVLRALAFERRTSMAALVRRAVERAYHEDFEDVRIMEEELAAHRADPSSSIDYEEFRKELLSGLPASATAESHQRTA